MYTGFFIALFLLQRSYLMVKLESLSPGKLFILLKSFQKKKIPSTGKKKIKMRKNSFLQ